MTVVQLALDISLDPVYRWENFYISSSNDDAISLLQRWPNWDNRVQLIYGSRGSGKTHISHLWRTESRASFVDNDIIKLDHLAEYVTTNPFLIFENVDKATCYEGLLHLYNLINEYQGYLLLTAETPPRNWNVPLADLASRLQSIPATEIKAPDDDLMQALLIKRFADMQLRVPGHILKYLMRHMERSYTSIDKVCLSLDRTSLEQKRNLTIPLVKYVLANV